VLAAERRVNDVVARYGGEEFAVILVDSSKFTAAKIAEKLREDVFGHEFPRRPRNDGRDGRDARDSREGKISISVGVATFPDDATDPEALVRAADAALYAAKRAGRNRIVLGPVSSSAG
jgi:diguanylate cyclase (GGDEF)-like protein